jgi:hypothetical protein
MWLQAAATETKTIAAAKKAELSFTQTVSALRIISSANWSRTAGLPLATKKLAKHKKR